MPIKQPRRFVTTDQGHADVLNVPIDTLYENDQALAAQIENIKNDPAGNDIASKAALDNHVSNTDLHVTAAKQATWNAAEGNAKKYTEQYAAPKAHTHPASDLPSASTQARGIVQINTSVSSTATDQAAAPIAVKTANDRANEAYNLAQQSLTQAVDLKNKIVGAINGKGGSANTDMTADQIVASLNNMPVKKYANGNLNMSISGEPDGGQTAALPAAMTRTFQLPTGFNIGRLFIRVSAYVYAIISQNGGWNQFLLPSGLITVAPDAQGDISNTNGSIAVSLSGTTVTVFVKSGIYSGAPRRYEAGISLWWAIE